MTSLWKRLGSWFAGGSSEQKPLLPETTTTSAGTSAATPVRAPARPEEETWLDELITHVGEGKRLEVIGDEDFWQRIQGLWKHGHERLAAEWLEKFISAPSTPADVIVRLRARVVELYDELGELLAAVPHLDALTRIEAHATRAHYLLGEHHRRQGDEARALRHYEAVLARDMSYPNVRGRVERLRLIRGQGAPVPMGETIVGAEAMGVTSGARYRLIRELGRGGTGVVYLARDAELERDVAVKLLHPHLSAANRAEACARFFEEARISASLRHPNIMAVLDLDERSRRIVMELAAGGTMRDVLRERGPRPLRRAVERHTQILSALAAAHRRGIVHRDLKPGNLMFRRDADEPGSEVVLGDFGVAHLPNVQGVTGADAVTDRKPAEAVGTLAYMSPEQRRGADADPRSDLYAAAVVLYEMLTCSHPWPREVLLSGVRKRGDFRLPEPILRHAPVEVARRLQAHLDQLGDPLPTGRPDTGTALAEARELRNLMIAELGPA